MYEVLILGVGIEAWADFAIVEMAVAIDGNWVFLQKSQEERAECGFLFRGACVGGDTMFIETADVGHCDGVTIVTTTMVGNGGHVVGFEDGPIFEDDEVVAETRGCLVAHEVGGFHFAVWAIGGAVDDYLSNLAHYG